MVTWQHRLHLGDVFHDEERPFPERRDEIVRRIRAASWYSDDDWDLSSTVEAIADCEDEDEFDQEWNGFYDYADGHRIWVETWQREHAQAER